MRWYTVFLATSLMATLAGGCATAPFVRASATEKPDIFRVYSNLAALHAVDPQLDQKGYEGVNDAATAIASSELRKQSLCLTRVEIYNPARVPYPVARLERSNEILYLVKCIK